MPDQSMRSRERARRRRAGVMARAVIALAVVAVPWPAEAQETRRVVVSAVERENVPTASLAPADLEVKLAGKVQPIVEIKKAESPLRVAVLVADGGTGAFMPGLNAFARKIAGHGELQFVSVIIQPQKLGEYAREPAAIVAMLNRLGPRGGDRSGAQLVDAIYDAAKSVRAEGARSAILVLRIGGEAASDTNAKLVREEIAKSGASLFVLSTANANRSASADDLGSLNLNLILGDGARESGGRHDDVVTTTLVKMMEGVADELLNQYEVTFTAPSNARPTDRISVSAKRRGLTVRTASR